MEKILKHILFLNKDLCYLCKSEKDDKFSYLCGQCYEKLELVHRRYGLEIKYVDEAYYSGIYNRFAREIIRDFKFHNKSYIYRPLVNIMEETLELIDLNEIDMIIPIPIHRKKKAKRGYNQTELLARGLAEKTGIPLRTDILKKTKNTRPQSSLDSFERDKNLESAFKLVNKKEVYGKIILLIDDILTTGSTFNHSSKELKEAGASKIVALSFVSANKL